MEWSVLGGGAPPEEWPVMPAEFYKPNVFPGFPRTTYPALASNGAAPPGGVLVSPPSFGPSDSSSEPDVSDDSNDLTQRARR